MLGSPRVLFRRLAQLYLNGRIPSLNENPTQPVQTRVRSLIVLPSRRLFSVGRSATPGSPHLPVLRRSEMLRTGTLLHAEKHAHTVIQPPHPTSLRSRAKDHGKLS
ncbi:hypothetical protein FQA47_002419 [Oryzias melastigma]|uniref:Uncharacterized protein n=1 Tax=Oryzias melastigma TaxID=30732 RepID=A0A834KZ24_ORYME|nr:hypothetical protein FQA47_002419 [Oryzias melastigma]